MPVILNASTSSGLVLTPDTSGVLEFQNNGIPAGTLCRAWVNFNGTGTVAIRASFNVSSISDNGAGLYTVNLTNAMPDVNFSVAGMSSRAGTTGQAGAGVTVTDNSVNTARTTSSVQVIMCANGGDGAFDVNQDQAWVCVQIFR
jgi:hypothetical protein